MTIPSMASTGSVQFLLSLMNSTRFPRYGLNRSLSDNVNRCHYGQGAEGGEEQEAARTDRQLARL